MDDFEFESKIIQNAETWISKSALFRKVGGNRNRFFRKLDDLTFNGTIDRRKVMTTHYLKRNLANSDDETWNSVYDFIEKQFVNVSGELIQFPRLHTIPHLFNDGGGVIKSKKKQIKPSMKIPFDTFCFNVDTILQHVIKLEYAKLFALVPLNKVEKRQKRFQKLLKKQVDLVLSSLKNDFDREQFKIHIQSIDRTWNMHV